MPSTKRVKEALARGGQAFTIVNLGCKVNRVEADTMSARLIARGWAPADEEQASLIIVNTCTVTGEADKKARKAVRHALKAAPDADVIVTGCGVSIDPEPYLSLDERVLAIERADLLLMLSPLATEPLRMGTGFRTRVNVKVQDGCNRACTFCIVHVARGRATSTPVQEVVGEVRSYLKCGVKEIVLTGIDLGSYSSDGMGLAGLTSALLEESLAAAKPGEQPARIRASSLEPVSVDDDFISLLEKSDGLVCRHLHLPLQSGSSKVLREMARPYSTAGFLDLVQELRTRIPTLSLTTDIICGFPGETADDFEQTLEAARACAFSKIHVFPYSRREGTPAAERADQVEAGVKDGRAARLRALSEELRAADRLKRAGTVELALVEGEKALTESYHEIEVGGAYRDGSLVPLMLD